jgi:hypothetical protein
MANESPKIRALRRCSAGSLSARIEMKTTLSMPRTISSKSSVTKAIHRSGLLKNSMAL